jgi:hypothetical protein
MDHLQGSGKYSVCSVETAGYPIKCSSISGKSTVKSYKYLNSAVLGNHPKDQCDPVLFTYYSARGLNHVSDMRHCDVIVFVILCLNVCSCQVTVTFVVFQFCYLICSVWMCLGIAVKFM